VIGPEQGREGGRVSERRRRGKVCGLKTWGAVRVGYRLERNFTDRLGTPGWTA
jgi:hypothetical protein